MHSLVGNGRKGVFLEWTDKETHFWVRIILITPLLSTPSSLSSNNSCLKVMTHEKAPYQETRVSHFLHHPLHLISWNIHTYSWYYMRQLRMIRWIKAERRHILGVYCWCRSSYNFLSHQWFLEIIKHYEVDWWDESQVNFIYIAQYHKSKICLKGLYNLCRIKSKEMLKSFWVLT